MGYRIIIAKYKFLVIYENVFEFPVSIVRSMFPCATYVGRIQKYESVS
jgi:hypothetical protein